MTRDFGVGRTDQHLNTPIRIHFLIINFSIYRPLSQGLRLSPYKSKGPFFQDILHPHRPKYISPFLNHFSVNSHRNKLLFSTFPWFFCNVGWRYLSTAHFDVLIKLRKRSSSDSI
jgi:hypothetical protein